MTALDGDEGPLYSELLGKAVARDIVQFVPFNEHKDDPMKLAKATLAELPRQMVDYFQSRNINPLPAAEEQRAAMKVMLQQKGGRFMSFNQMLDIYTSDRMAKMQQLCQAQGYDPNQVMHLLSNFGVPQDDANIVCEALSKG